MRLLLTLVACVGLGQLYGSAQTATVPVARAFEIVSIKANNSGEGSTRVNVLPGGRFVMTNGTPMTLLLNAYQAQPHEIVGAPTWMSSERYDVTAVAGGDVPIIDLQAMLKTMLADRFKLVVHNEVQEVPVYVLGRAGSEMALGASLRPWTIDCQTYKPDPSVPSPAAGRGRGQAPPPVCGMRAGSTFFVAGGLPISALASSLASALNRRVIDETGLAGDFEITLRWAADGADLGDQPSLFTAIREQLGLRLESTKRPGNVLVLDRAEPATEN